MRLNHIAQLGENWDGYGAGPFLPEVVAHARVFYKALLADRHGVAVTPMSNGTIMLEWEVAGEEYTLEIGKTQIAGMIEPK